MFTALNAADNYILVYYTDENETEERGRIECFGYGIVNQMIFVLLIQYYYYFYLHYLFFSSSSLLWFWLSFSCRSRVESFTVEETESYGAHGFKLVPYLDTKRSWYFCADSEEEKNEWQSVCDMDCITLTD